MAKRQNEPAFQKVGIHLPFKDLGEHPTFGGMVAVKDGRFGPYVNLGKVNATLPSGSDPQEMTLETAVELIAAKIEKSGKGPDGKKIGGTTKKPAAKNATAKKKAAAKKPAAKKKPAKKAVTKKAE